MNKRELSLSTIGMSDDPLEQQMRDWLIEREKMIGVDQVLIADGIALLMRAHLRQRGRVRADAAELGLVRGGPAMAAVVQALPKVGETFRVAELAETVSWLRKQQVTDALKYLLARGRIERVSWGKYRVVV